jgi:hypothetical protein
MLGVPAGMPYGIRSSRRRANRDALRSDAGSLTDHAHARDDIGHVPMTISPGRTRGRASVHNRR